MGLYLGIDTSCYTTSAAVADGEGHILCNLKIPLEVATGQKGLQQSQAVFLHIRNLRRMFEENSIASLGRIEAVCVSAAPRPQEGSYMPVFMVSAAAGAIAASVTGARLHYATHQHGHIAAAMIGKQMPERFLAVHVSGGTTEILDVTQRPDGYAIEIVGATRDIAAGQVVDRVGQKLGFSFPAGREMEECAAHGEPAFLFKTSACGPDLNFSGVEAQAIRLVGHAKKEDICRAVLEAVAETLGRAVKNAAQQTGLTAVLLFGGVMSNKLIRLRLAGVCPETCFAEIEYSADNAAGLAVLASKLERGTNTQ